MWSQYLQDTEKVIVYDCKLDLSIYQIRGIKDAKYCDTNIANRLLGTYIIYFIKK